MEDSIHLAIDTRIDDVIITGDLNLNISNPQSARKIQSQSEQFSLPQCISKPTHFTEHSSSLIDILLLTKPNHLILSGVGDPFYSKMCVIIVLFTEFLILQSQNRNHTFDIIGNMNKGTMVL